MSKYDTIPTQIKLETAILHKIRMGLSVSMPKSVLDSFSVGIAPLHNFCEDLVVSIRWQMASMEEEISTSNPIYIPSRPIDHFRQRYFPKFLARRYPIKLTKIDKLTQVRNTFIYPNLPITTDERINAFNVAYTKSGGKLDTRLY